MKITAVTVSVNYDDFLKYSLEANYKFFDRWIVVTDLKGESTIDLCKNYSNVEVIQTDIFYKDGAIFRKYAGINEALKLVDEDSWVLFIDGDIILSQWTRRILEKLDLDKTKLYGIDRLDCKGFEKWIEYKKGKNILHENWLLHSAGLEWGARIIHIYGE